MKRWRQVSNLPNPESWKLAATTTSDVEGVKGVHQVVEVVLGLLRPVRLALGDADRQANGIAAVADQFAIALLGGDVQGVAAAEQTTQVDLQSRDAADRRPRDGGRLVVGEHDGLLG